MMQLPTDVGKGREQDAVALRRESSCSPSYIIRSGEICCFQNKETAIGNLNSSKLLI